MTPRTGRPHTENPRKNKVGIALSDEDLELAKEAREKDKEPERSFSTWLARIVHEAIRRFKK